MARCFPSAPVMFFTCGQERLEEICKISSPRQGIGRTN
jgi:hypothetical protein